VQRRGVGGLQIPNHPWSPKNAEHQLSHYILYGLMFVWREDRRHSSQLRSTEYDSFESYNKILFCSKHKHVYYHHLLIHEEWTIA
jgi:hypothetical protein